MQRYFYERTLRLPFSASAIERLLSVEFKAKEINRAFALARKRASQ